MQGEITVSQLPLTGNLSILGGLGALLKVHLLNLLVSSHATAFWGERNGSSYSGPATVAGLVTAAKEEIKGRSITHSCLKWEVWNAASICQSWQITVLSKMKDHGVGLQIQVSDIQK